MGLKRQNTRLLFFAPILRIFSGPEGYEAFTLQGVDAKMQKKARKRAPRARAAQRTGVLPPGSTVSERSSRTLTIGRARRATRGTVSRSHNPHAPHSHERHTAARAARVSPSVRQRPPMCKAALSVSCDASPSELGPRGFGPPPACPRAPDCGVCGAESHTRELIAGQWAAWPPSLTVAPLPLR